MRNCAISEMRDLITQTINCGTASFAYTAQALHWERGRPARNEREARARRRTLSVLRDQSHLAVLVAGGTPAVPVKSLSGLSDGATEVRGFWGRI